jgi:pyruvate/2-oxoglutarate dehydrogenase complex dihydrolipoamide acyltransferase (E2) component
MSTVPVNVPQLSMAMVEGTFIEWLVPDGATVVEQQPIYTFATDKVDVDVESPAAGVLRRGDVTDGGEYPVGYQVATIEQ